MPQEHDPFNGLRKKLRSCTPRRVEAPFADQASVALVLVPSQGKGMEVLLIERAQALEDPWSGQVALPGGRSEVADVDRLATAIREAQEETGILLRREDFIGELDDLSPRTATYPELAVRPFVFGLMAKPATMPGPEAADCFWLELTAPRPAVCEAAFRIAGEDRVLPAFKAGPRTVWGITYRILTSCLGLLEG